MFDEHEGTRHEISAELAALERQLASLTPAAPRIDRDRLMFAAGQAAARAESKELRARSRRQWFWPAATATMTAATVLLATMLVWREPVPTVTQQLTTSNLDTLPRDNTPSLSPDNTLPLPLGEGRGEGELATTSPPSASPSNDWRPVPSATSGYLSVRYIALTRGVAALDPAVPSSDGGDSTGRERHKPATARELLDELLPRSTESTQARS